MCHPGKRYCISCICVTTNNWLKTVKEGLVLRASPGVVNGFWVPCFGQKACMEEAAGRGVLLFVWRQEAEVGRERIPGKDQYMLQATFQLALLVKAPHGTTTGTQCITHEPAGTFHVQTVTHLSATTRKHRTTQEVVWGGEWVEMGDGIFNP